MQRRSLVLALPSLLAIPGLGYGQSRPKQVRIGILAGDLITPQEEEALLAGLRAHGLVEGRNLTIERRVADSRLNLVPGFARELAGLKLDAVISTCSATTMLALQAIGSTPEATPIVMAAVADPVAQQFISSLARPGSNVTGLASLGEETMPKSLSLFAAVLPARARIAVLLDASSKVHPQMWRALEPVAARMNLRLVQLQAGRRPGQPSLSEAFDAAMRQQVNGILVLPDEPFFFARRAEIVALADKHRLPAFYGLREFVDAGGLMSYGESMVAAFRNVGGYVAKVASGVKPGEIPVAQPTLFELVVNQKTAKALGITFPQDVLISASSVVE